MEISGSHEFRQLIFEYSPLSIIVMDGETFRYVDCNPAAIKIYGYSSRDEVVGKTPLDMSAKLQYDGTPSAELVPYYINKAIKGGSAVFEWRHCRPDGTFWDAEVHLHSFIVQEKQFLQFSIVDITERKKTEEALKRSEMMFKTLFMSVSDGIYLSEPLYNADGLPYDYRYVEVNPQFEKILAMSRDSIIGKTYKDIVPVDTTEWLPNYFKVVTTGEPNTYSFYSAEFRMHFETYACRMTNGLVAVFVRNITERKHTETVLHNMQKLDALGILAGGIAHDFNNLLSGIFGYVDLAAGSTKEEERTSLLVKTLQSIERARGLTQQLLTFAKGGLPVKKIEPFSPFIEETVRFALSGSNCSGEFTIPGDLWSGEFDSSQIGQVIDNIIINAQQAMPLGGVIKVFAENIIISGKNVLMLSEGKYVKISIIDKGIGIPNDILSRIFDPFFTTKPKNHGLGLATCYSIVNKHGGAIDVESEPGKGTAFHVYIPAAVHATSVKTDKSDGDAFRGSGTILVMDDEEALRDITGGMLRSFGFSVVCVKNGMEALRIYQEDRAGSNVITGMIVDLTVPGGMGGKDMIGEIRKNDRQIPVIVASGYADDPIMADPQGYGFTASICKPFRTADLARVFAGIFKIRK